MYAHTCRAKFVILLLILFNIGTWQTGRIKLIGSFKHKAKHERHPQVFFTYFYVSRRKYWFRANFRFPVFDGFIRFGTS